MSAIREVQGEKRLAISLRGEGAIWLDGTEIQISNRKVRAILLILSLSPRYRATRSSIKDKLWGEKGEEKSAANLRQALSLLKKQLNIEGEIVGSNRESIWLGPETFHVLYPGNDEILLDGLDIRDEGFNDWLALERSRVEARFFNQQNTPTPDASAHTPEAHSTLLGIGILAPIQTGFQGTEPGIANIISDILGRELRNFGIADTYNYRSLITPSMTECDSFADAVDMFVQITVHWLDSQYLIGCAFYDSLDNRQLWSGFCKVQVSENYLFSVEFRTFMNQVMDVALFILNSPTFTSKQEKRLSAKLALAAIYEILQARHGNLDKATEYLDKAYEANKRSVYLAWKTHLSAYLLGERLIDNQDECKRQVREVVAIATEAGKHNPITLALVAHVHSFIFRDYPKAIEIFQQMHQLNPNHAICFDLSAVTNVYTNQKKKAYEEALLARNLGWFGPYRYCIDTTCAMAAAINKDYPRAVFFGLKATDRKPTYTAALRYFAASQSMAGDSEGAKASYSRLLQLEPDFTVGSVFDKNYPVAGMETANFLGTGLSRIGA